MNFIRPLILASNSPRRKQLLQEAGFTFTVKTQQVTEDYPAEMPLISVAKYLAEKKAMAFNHVLEDEIVIAADTVVIQDNTFLGKPKDAQEAENMLRLMSGKMHRVITGMCLLDRNKKISFDAATEVYFKNLTTEEINFYIEHYKPYDKAGAYGIQEWIGLIGIEKIVGSYYNVVGLPVQKLYEELWKF
ncbi:MAG: Maf family nucleotide pyrophosphatase [Bacteroidota bacterium]|nr:Maf family nucleotide pyrophosphatase [Bacteroidota bacterium]